MTKIILILMMMNSMMLMFCKTPLPMGLILLLQTTLISLNSGISSFTFFFSYILFMILLGGMLVLFIYISSLTPNMKFKFNKKIFIFMFMMLIMMILMMFYFNINLNFNMMNYNLMMEQNYLLKLSLKKMFNYPNNLIMLLMINYLLITLFIVVKIININKGPLRKI
uniref:NADH dehydrogenase subunit 6 n=1 Tax=Orientabia sinica TaxID=2714596 RepID=UPI002238464D|nr:NADH dehydrogenase subunit 6 [Orientabia sinica]UYK52050.1 NADH dehydrogenase subunit 6 [Orientabia sinica]